MDDINIFETFLTDVAGVITPTAIAAVTQYIGTFNALLSTRDKEIEDFVKNTHHSNSGLTARNKIYISPAAVLSLQAMLFELKDRQRCGALPNANILRAITPQQIVLVRQARSQAKEQRDQRNNTTLPTMSIPKFIGTNYDEFMTAFTTLASRQIGANEIPLDYLMRDNDIGDYNSPYASREEKLKTCILFQGDNFLVDRASLYSLFVEHIGTTGLGSSIVNKHSNTRNGRRCHSDFKLHFANATYLQNKATAANLSISTAAYHGIRRNFTIETYYNIMTTAFNDLALSGPAHIVNDPQKITKFENGLKDHDALKFSISAKTEWDRLPENEQTFDKYYNLFSASMSKYNTLTQPPSQLYNNRRINALSHNDNNTNKYGRGRGRGNGRGRGRGRGGRGFGRGRGRGRGGRGRGSYNDQSHYGPAFAPVYGNFVPEAKIYPQNTFRSLSIQQKRDIANLKSNEGWTDSVTPPGGFTIDQNTGFAVPSNAIISAIRTANINAAQSQPNANAQHFGHHPNGPPPFINLPPPPILPPIPPPISPYSTSNAGTSFGRSGNRDNASISAVSINGQAYTGQVFDNNGRPLN